MLYAARDTGLAIYLPHRIRKNAVATSELVVLGCTEVGGIAPQCE